MKAREVVEVKPMMLLPPAKGKCQECAVDHDPSHPHDATSLFYAVKVKMQTGKEATWALAMEHCSDFIKAHWKSELERLGIDVNSFRTRGNR